MPDSKVAEAVPDQVGARYFFNDGLDTRELVCENGIIKVTDTYSVPVDYTFKQFIADHGRFPIYNGYIIQV